MAVVSKDALQVLNAAACGLARTAENGTFLFINTMFCQWLGVAADDVIGKRRLQEFLNMGGRIFHQTHWAPLMRMQGSVSEVKLIVQHADGSELPMVFNALRAEHEGQVVHEIAAFIARDRDKYERELVLSRRRLEEMVANATKLEAEAKDRALFAEQLIGIVSHDLRNPLSVIAMGARQLDQAGPSPAALKTVKRIGRAVDRAQWLIADMLDFTRARLGQTLTHALAPFDLHATVAGCIEELAPLHPGRTLEHVSEGEGPCSGDANRIVQMVGNLVTNAMAYGHADVAVTVTSRVEATSFSIRVHNGGEPIPLEQLPTLFEPLTRGKDSQNTGRSIGLGLFIVREIMRAHGGTVTVASTAAEGTTFQAVFPRHAD